MMRQNTTFCSLLFRYSTTNPFMTQIRTESKNNLISNCCTKMIKSPLNDRGNPHLSSTDDVVRILEKRRQLHELQLHFSLQKQHYLDLIQKSSENKISMDEWFLKQTKRLHDNQGRKESAHNRFVSTWNGSKHYVPSIHE
jgi:hypothetical protein